MAAAAKAQQSALSGALALSTVAVHLHDVPAVTGAGVPHPGGDWYVPVREPAGGGLLHSEGPIGQAEPVRVERRPRTRDAATRAIYEADPGDAQARHGAVHVRPRAVPGLAHLRQSFPEESVTVEQAQPFGLGQLLVQLPASLTGSRRRPHPCAVPTLPWPEDQQLVSAPGIKRIRHIRLW
jgi:hypothetical protein